MPDDFNYDVPRPEVGIARIELPRGLAYAEPVHHGVLADWLRPQEEFEFGSDRAS